MIRPAATLTLREWETQQVGERALSRRKADRLHVVAERAARRLGLPETAVLTRTVRGLKAGQVVGILSTPGLTLEILPKIGGEEGAERLALVRMLAVAWDLRIADGELAALDTQRHDLLEFLIRLFAERLFAVVRRGLPRRYRVHEEDLARLRGRLDIKRQFTRLTVRPDRLACRFDQLSEDIPLNRVFKAVVGRLVRLARSVPSARRLTELSASFERVGDSFDPLGEPVRLDRTNTAFHDVYRLAKVFLGGDWQSTAGGRSPGFSLLFPMNELFEKYIGRCLKRALASYPVHLQHRGKHSLEDAAGDGLFALVPDVVLGEPVAGPIILDTKWKRLTPHAPRCKRTLGVEQSDVYQMLAYSQAYDAKRVVLVYPWHDELDEKRYRSWRISGQEHSVLDIATVNVGRPNTVEEVLREIVRSTLPLPSP